MIRLMILSAGGLAAQNILDSLESRRSEVITIGLDASGTHSRISLYDNAHLVSQATNKEDLEKQLLKLIDSENPDMILPGADHDVLFLSSFKEKYSEYQNLIPCGSNDMAKVISDKWLSYQFCIQENLPLYEAIYQTTIRILT